MIILIQLWSVQTPTPNHSHVKIFPAKFILRGSVNMMVIISLQLTISCGILLLLHIHLYN